MFQQFSLYIVIGLLVVLIAMGGGFILYRNNVKAEIAELTRANASYELVVKQQTDTIQTMEKNAQLLAAANRDLNHRMIDAETNFVDEWSAINELDLASEEAIANSQELERKVNEEFRKSIEGLRSVSGSCRSSVELCKH